MLQNFNKIHNTKFHKNSFGNSLLIYLGIWTDKHGTASGYILISSMKAAVRTRQKFISDTNLIPNSKQFPNFHIHSVHLFANLLEKRVFRIRPLSFFRALQ
jgi:hypothetical protein